MAGDGAAEKEAYMKTFSTKNITFLGMLIALYVVLGLVMNIPLLAGSHLQTDLGYIAFAVALMMFGWQGMIVGVIGCLIESLVVSGWVPFGWMLGQAAIGIICGLAYKKTDNKIIHVVVTIAAVFIGIAGIKTLVECRLYSIPFAVKFAKNFIAFIADAVPMIIGLLVGYRLIDKRVIREGW